LHAADIKTLSAAFLCIVFQKQLIFSSDNMKLKFKFTAAVWRSLILVTAVLTSASTSLQAYNTSQADTLRLFLIGNSFSQNATRYLPKLAAEGGHPLKIGRAELGGCSLQRHWEIAEAAENNPNDPKGKAYNGKSLRELLSTGVWDVVTIQQNSMNSGDVATYQPYAKKLYDLVRSIQPNARIVMHQTWAYRTDAKKFTQTAEKQFAVSAKDMWEKSRAAYQTVSKDLGIPLIPVGDAFWKINSGKETAFKPNLNAVIDNPVYPNLPKQQHSLHVGYKWNKDQTLGFDANHANEAGCFLGGLVWYSFLFKESPVKLQFRPDEVDELFSNHLRKVAAEVTKNRQ
jgi:hypothetical protein